MPQYLVAVYRPDDYDPSVETEAMMEKIHALNREMIAAGARKFACGLSPAGDAKSLRVQPDGKVLVTDGPYTETKEHIGGFWILEAANMDEALAWARKGAVACRASGEVREILFRPAPEQNPAEASKQPGHCGLRTRAVVPADEGKRAATATEPCTLKDGLTEESPFSGGKQCGKRRLAQSQSKASHCSLCLVRCTTRWRRMPQRLIQTWPRSTNTS
jgi:hypothetical protein